MKGLLVILMFVIVSHSMCARIKQTTFSTFNVLTYGAKGDGETDDSNSFVKAWKDVCGTTHGAPTLIIPKHKTFMLQPLSFQGPCKSTTVNIEIDGTITAPKHIEAWKWADNRMKSWVTFSKISGLVVKGEGNIDGQGAPWWNKYPSDESNRPTALSFHGCENLKLSHLTHTNSPRNHIGINSCKGASISNLKIHAPEHSPNTDGIDISSSSNILIENLIIETGDDCIAINSGSSFINITGIFCGPGHGISVGSLGKGGEYATVEQVHVKNCTFKGTSNGARIKTWKGGSGYAKKITYEDIKLIDVKNPVIIDQHYNPKFLDNAKNAVKVSDVTYRNIYGTSSMENAIEFSCDPSTGCNNIVLDHINITLVAGKKAQVSCSNAHGRCSSCSPKCPMSFLKL